jgi:hypothetical protein
MPMLREMHVKSSWATYMLHLRLKDDGMRIENEKLVVSRFPMTSLKYTILKSNKWLKTAF